jgi:hypothetical protein
MPNASPTISKFLPSSVEAKAFPRSPEYESLTPSTRPSKTLLTTGFGPVVRVTAAPALSGSPMVAWSSLPVFAQATLVPMSCG